jgi:hypothetical protein
MINMMFKTIASNLKAQKRGIARPQCRDHDEGCVPKKRVDAQKSKNVMTGTRFELVQISLLQCNL